MSELAAKGSEASKKALDQTQRERAPRALLDRIAKTTVSAPDDVRLAMNDFITTVGTYVAPLGAQPSQPRARLAPSKPTWATPPAKFPPPRATF